MWLAAIELDKLSNFVDPNGYIMSYIQDHPYANKGYVHLHRLVMEKHIGFALAPDIVVHHIDLNKTHNSITNLFLTTQNEHAAIHNRMRAGMSAAKRANISKGVKKYYQKQKSGNRSNKL